MTGIIQWTAAGAAMDLNPDVRIRPYGLDDAADLCAAAHECVRASERWMPWCHADYAIEEAQAWISLRIPAFEKRSAFEFVITAHDGSYLGGCGLNQIDAMNRRANLGYWVRPSARRRGVASTAVCLLREWAFRETDLVRLELVVPTTHVASLRVVARAGAVREGTLRKRLIVDGVCHDTAVFSFVRPDDGRSLADASAS